MHNPLRISIITPSLNQAGFIERTIRSVLAQDYPNIEYIVIDGGSTDNTVEILKSYGSRIVWISEKDEGQSDAINKGISMATGDIIAYLNSDDLYEPGALSAAAEVFAKDRSVMWLTGRCRIMDEADHEVRRLITAYKNFLLAHYSYALLLVANPISQPATFWRREIVGEFGPFDLNEHLAMDYEYWLRIGRKYPPLILKRYLAGFRVHQASKTTSFFIRTYRQELEIARRYSDSRLLDILHLMHYWGMISVHKLLMLIPRRQQE